MTLREELQGFYKVGKEVGGGYIHVVMFNPSKKEVKKVLVDDTEYQKEIQLHLAKQYGLTIQQLETLRYSNDNEQARKEYLKYLGVIGVGDTVEVFKGRKVPKGTVSKVVNIYDYKDQYGRTQTTYVVLEDGQKTNINNCRLV